MILKLDAIKRHLKSLKSEEPLSKRLNDFRKIHYIELLILLFNLAQGLRASANFPSFYAKVCHEIYSSTPEICSNLKYDKSAEFHVQQETARWLMYNELITFLPNLIMAMFFGSFGDKYGRKVPTLIAIASMVLHNFFYMSFVSMQIFPVYVLIIEAGLISLGGTKTVFVSAQYAEAANQTKDKSKLTQRFSILTACISCAIFLAGYVSKVLLTYCSLQWIMVIGQVVMTAAFLFAVLFHSPTVDEEPKNVKDKNTVATATLVTALPKIQKGLVRLSSVEVYGRCIAPRKAYAVKLPEKPDHIEWFDRMLELYRSAWNALTKKRPNHGRAHLFLFCFVGLIYSCADSGMDTVTTLYVYHEPIAWTPSIFSEYMATMSIAQLIGGLGGTHLLKRFKCSDYTVVLVGLTSAILKLVCTSLATNTWMMYLALALGCVSNVGISSLRSLITQLGTSDETGELTSMLSIVMGWSQLTGSVVCNNVYTATLIYFTGATFAVVASLLSVCFFIVLALAYHEKRVIRKANIRRNDSAVFYIEALET